MKKMRNSTIREVILGSVIALVLLLLGTYFMGKYAKDDTESAVHSISLFYLGELAGRREQVVANTISDFTSKLAVSLELLEPSDLTSIESMQNYLNRMRHLYDIDRLAFVDENGVIYTSRGTRTDIDLYQFDYKKLSEPSVSVKNMYGNNKKVIIAIPMDRIPFQNTHLVVGFMEIDMVRMLAAISLQSDHNNTTFANLYTRDGIALTNVILGGLASEKNLLEAMRQADFEKNSSLEKMIDDFKEGREGVQTFTYNNINETMYYIPIKGTDWILTYLVRESVISEQISNISDSITERSLIQSFVTAIVLIAVFGFVIYQTRSAAKATLDKEIADTESRVKQQELEEQLALQEELLEKEKRRTEQDRVITAMAADYKSVYYIDLEKDEGICYKKLHRYESIAEEGTSFKFSEAFKEYAIRYIDGAYLDGFLAFIKPEQIQKALSEIPIITYRYLIRMNGREEYEMLKIAGVKGNNEAGVPTIITVGFADCDEEMRTALEKSQTLADALQTAEDASKAKTVFLSNMSHEIRTPMNAIIGLDTLALNDPNLPDSTKEYLEKIGISAKHLLNLINDILDMSRIESGRMALHTEEFSFPKFLEQINTIIGGQCQENGLTYDCRVVGDFADYYIGDSAKLRQVLINLLGNAVKFTTAPGNVTLIAKKLRTFDNKTAITFKVSDTGIGMSEEFLPKIFETFSQEDSSARNKYGSSGLGLAISKNIVDMMNGEISVESQKGVGTTFTVTVTLSDSKRTDDNKDEEIIMPDEIHALVVDDDPIAREHAKLTLNAAGIEVDLAESGAEAVHLLKMQNARRNNYDLMIIDWQMPGMDGIACAKELRKLTQNETSIIMLTAYNWDDIVDEAIEAGVDSFIAKPLFAQVLLDEFKKTLKRKHLELESKKKVVDLNGRRVLLAEDMIVNAEIMKEILKMKGIEADHAENGKIAVELFEKSEPNTYSAILMDIRMPEMTGLEATVAIRKLDRDDAKKVPIIALTANAFDEDVEKSLQAGLNAHLAKPVDPDMLFKTLEEMVECTGVS